MHDAFDPEAFSGIGRLFPLPNLVLFPHVVQPLHIFEPRYRQLTEDALADDRLITMVLAKPDEEVDACGQPRLHDMACVGRIVADQRMPDGRFNLLLRGECRFRIDRELDSDALYRSARGRLVPDTGDFDHPKLRTQIVDQAMIWLPGDGQHVQQFRSVISGPLPFGALCDILAFALPLPFAEKQALLEELDQRRRGRRLAKILAEHKPAEQLPMPREKRPFPPEFSAN
jgi:Lon protease-like protein